MFPLKTREITGYKFGVPTFYSKFHLGVDYGTEDMEVRSPFDGQIVLKTRGTEGGNTLWFKPKNRPVVIRFLHLSKFLVSQGQQVKEGQLIAITGNTGHSTQGHLHLDISKNNVNINNIKNFIDPEKYDWEGDNMQLVNDKGTIYIVTGVRDKRKIGIVDKESLGLFGDEPQTQMDTSGIPEYNDIKKTTNGFVITQK